jgi:arsenite methyltransferase
MTTETTFWDTFAAKYAAMPVKDKAAFERKKAVLREHLQPGASVFELGCGTGSLALDMAPLARHISALDSSAEMIRIATGKRDAQGVHNVELRQGTIESATNAQLAHYDCAWAFSVLHLVPDRKRALAGLFALLKPGGTLVSSNVCLGDSWLPYRPFVALAGWLGKAPARVHIYDRATLLRELREVGFVDVQERDVGADKTVAFVVANKPG